MSIKIGLFLLFFAYTATSQAATLSALPNLQSSQTISKNIKTAKLLKKSLKKMRRSNFAGLEAYAYMMLFLLIMLLMGIGFTLSLVFNWTIAAWIFGLILAIQVLICLVFFISLIR